MLTIDPIGPSQADTAATLEGSGMSVDGTIVSRSGKSVVNSVTVGPANSTIGAGIGVLTGIGESATLRSSDAGAGTSAQRTGSALATSAASSSNCPTGLIFLLVGHSTIFFVVSIQFTGIDA